METRLTRTPSLYPLLTLAGMATVESGPLHERDTSPRDVAKPVSRRAGPRVGRNDPCPCGSGRKAKRCCRAK